MCMTICCSVGSAFCSCLCWPAKALGATPSNYAKIAYAGLHAFFLMIALIFVLAIDDNSDWVQEKLGTDCMANGVSVNCFGPSTYIRMSFALAVFHLLTLLIIAVRTEPVAAYHDGCWCLKMVLVLGAFIGSFWIENDPFFLKGYMAMACVLSFGFLTFQTLYVMICAMTLNERMVANMSSDDSSCS